MNHTSTGIIRYKGKWIVVDCEDDIARYYRHLYAVSHHHTKLYNPPSWKAHITVVADESPPRQEFWHTHAEKLVEFTYSDEFKSDGQYVWLDVDCPYLLDLREELGLPRPPIYPLHLSIGVVP